MNYKMLEKEYKMIFSYQKDKKSINFGREFLGEDTYDTLDMLSVTGMPIAYQYTDYRRVIAEGDVAQRAIIYNPNFSYDESKFLINLDKLKVVENSTPEEANLYWEENAGYTNKLYDENYEVKLVKNNGEKFIPSMGSKKQVLGLVYERKRYNRTNFRGN